MHPAEINIIFSPKEELFWYQFRAMSDMDYGWYLQFTIHFLVVLACKQLHQVLWNQSIFTVFKPRAEVAQSPHCNSCLWASIHFASALMSAKNSELNWTRFTSSTHLDGLMLPEVYTHCRLLVTFLHISSLSISYDILYKHLPNCPFERHIRR